MTVFHLCMDIDNFTPDSVGTEEKSNSPVAEDLLMEMNSKGLKEFNGNMNTDCHRCRHFLNTPQNLLVNYEAIADSTKDCEHSIIFVQAIVWLKSAVKHRKDISTEQYSLLFHKLWPKNKEEGNITFLMCMLNAVIKIIK